ncbi:MAG TPA: methyltransferase domain-containing protein [Acidimicrobiales bacterium]|nr:methyltransferase domain-containing protein [Acidimicrobiales bacterium]
MDAPSPSRHHRAGGLRRRRRRGGLGRAAETYDTVIPFFAEFGARLVELADLRPGESVLDVGAGRGATLVPAAHRVGPSGRVLGVDLSEEMVALLTRDIDELGLANSTARRMNAEALDVTAESFDVALSSFVLHLLPRPDSAAANLWRALRPGGRVAASAPIGVGAQWGFLLPLLRRFAPRAVRPIPIPFRSDFDLELVLRSAGFRVQRSIDAEVAFVFADEWAWWDWVWSAGMRALLEGLSPEDLEELRGEAFSELAALRTPEGLPLHQGARLLIAEKPSADRPEG